MCSHARTTKMSGELWSWSHNLCSGNTAATCAAKGFLLCAGRSVSVCLLLCLTHWAGGIQYVIASLESDRGVGVGLFWGSAMCWCHSANPQLVCMYIFACVCVFYYHPASAVAFLPWLCKGGPMVCVQWFPALAGPQHYCTKYTPSRMKMHTRRV